MRPREATFTRKGLGELQRPGHCDRITFTLQLVKLHPGPVGLRILPASPCTISVLSAHSRLLWRASSSARSPSAARFSCRARLLLAQLLYTPAQGREVWPRPALIALLRRAPGTASATPGRSPLGGDLRVLSKLGHGSQMRVWPLPTHSAHQHCQLSSEWSLCGSVPKPEM